MIKYIDKGTTRQHLTDRLIECALNNVGVKADVDAVFLDIAKNRLPVWMDELQTYDVQEVRHARWVDGKRMRFDGTFHWFRQCSECLYEREDDTPEKDTNYCPNCGSRMDLEEEKK